MATYGRVNMKEPRRVEEHLRQCIFCTAGPLLDSGGEASHAEHRRMFQFVAFDPGLDELKLLLVG